MKKTFTKLFAALALLAFFIPSMIAVGQTTTTYTFTAKNWTATSGGSAANWTSGQDGGGFMNNGIQVTTTYSGANGTSPISFTNVTKIVATYNTNKSAGAGTIVAQIGDNTEVSKSWAYSGSGDGRSANYTVQWDYSTPQSGNVKITCNTTTNSIYLVSVAITTGGTPPCDSPIFGTSAGAYTSAQNVTISTTTSGATIYYTTDGTDPSTSSNVYSSAIPVNSTTTIKAMAVKSGYSNSSIASATYAIVGHAGTQADPYTVADALAVINAGVGMTNVYATGIVKAIPYAYTSNNGITFNMVDNVEDTDFIQAFKCTGTEAPNVVVGDVAVVNGNLTYYNNTTYEFTQGCTLVSLTHPSGTVLDPVFTPAAGGYSGTKTVEITCATENSTIYYTTNGTDPTNASTQYSSAITVLTNTTIKAIAYVGNNHSEVVTATYKLLTDSGTTVNTVTEALAYGTYPQNGVFVSGKVCTAPSSLISGGMLTYYISADGTDTDKLEVYKGMNMDNTAFTAVDDIQVGDIVTVYGNVKIYNSTKEFDQGNYLVAFQRPVVESITLSSYAIQATADESDGTLDITYTGLEISDMGDFGIQYYDGNGDEDTEPDWIEVLVAEEQGGGYVVSYLIDENEGEARETYFKVFAMGSEDFVYSDMVTVEQAAPTVDYAELPFEWEGGAKSDFEALTGTSTYSVGDYTGEAIYSMKLDGTDDYIQIKCNEQPGKITFGVKMVGGNSTSTITVQGSADGTSFTNVQAFSISGAQNSVHEYETSNTFESTDRYVRLLFTKGSNVGVGPISIAQVTNDPVIVADNSVELEYNETSGSISYSITNPTSATLTASTDADWISNITVGESTVTFSATTNEGSADRTATITLSYTGATDKTVTVTQGHYVAPIIPTTYTLATSIVSGKHYIIVGEKDGDYFAMGDQSTNNRKAYGITLDGTTASAEVASGENVHEFTITSLATAGFYSIQDATESGYLYAAASGSNHLKTEATLDESNNGDWEISINSETGVASVVASNSSNRNVMQFNSSSTLFSCYASASQSPVYLYQKDETATYTRTVTGYGNEPQVKTGWHLIASPLTSFNFISNTMLSGNYDLYRFNQAAELEWENKKYHADFTTFEPGIGYLYAHDTQIELSFTGEPYAGNGVVSLTYDDNAPHATTKGWNLIGNPFGTTAYLEGGEDFYIMNTNGSGLEVSTNPAIGLMHGIFVQATTTGQSVTFTTTVPSKRSNSQVVLNIVNNDNVIDRAIVRFNSDRQLGKLTLFDGDTKIYIPMGDKDYAIVSSNGQSTMPVNFKAKEMGRYTISVETEGIDLSYLHLIDRLTGEDIDLLLDSKYSFIASNSDMESRFILSFGENGINANGNETFAFQSGSDIIVNGEGELQIFDVMGRMVKNTTINGVETIAIPQGVYIFKLNGNVQKIVVR